MYYADYDESVNGYCVFHTENGHSFASYINEEEAEHDAEYRNNLIK